MDVYRTPDERFEALPGYPFEPRYVELDGLRLHYLDEGQGDPVLLLHGEPDWSYLYRRMVPILALARRVIAPDYFGFGRSDKPVDPDFYTYDRHVESIKALIERLDLRQVTVVMQDWGGPIGLRVAVEMRERFDRLVVLNTGLFGGKECPTEGFLSWRRFAQRAGLELPVGRIIQLSCVRQLEPEVVAAYEAPWPVPESKHGVARFPLLVPLDADDPAAAPLRRVAKELRGWEVPALVLWSDSDPVFPVEFGRRFAEFLPGAGEMEVIAGAGHMLQEDKGEEIAERIVRWVSSE